VVTTASGCLFCRIIARELDSTIVFENQDVIAFLDHRPVFHGHVLLIPRRHVETYDQFTSEELPAFALAAQRLQVAVEKAMSADGTFLAINNRVSQSVPHLHMHIVPRRFKDGLRGFFWPRQKYTAEITIEAVAERIRELAKAS
jgi:histidine triad (HIT) family protein